jgi:hypothetical protein
MYPPMPMSHLHASKVPGPGRFARSGLLAHAPLLISVLATTVGACAHQPPAPAARDVVELVAGGGSGGDGVPATEAKLTEPFGVARAPNGDLFVVEHSAHRIRRVDAAGIIHTVAGTGEKADGGDGGSGLQAKFNGPHHIAFSPAATTTGPTVLYIADTWNQRVRTLQVGGSADVVMTVVGNGKKGFAGDGGPANGATTGGIYCLAFDAKGQNLFFADLDNRRIRAVDLRTGLLRTVAGNGEKGVPVDGSEATSAPLVDPRAVAVDSAGNVYIAERSGHALRVVDGAGKIRTVVGNGEKGFSGDGGPGRDAKLSGPKHLGIDRDDTVLIVDTENHVIRRYDPRDGRITRAVGSGTRGAAGLGGPASAVQLDRPHGVYLDSNGDLLLADSENHRVLRVRR